MIIAIGAAGALVGIVQFAMLGYNDLDQRPRALLGHYMTYSGVLMLVTCAAVARLLFVPATGVWPAVAVPALLVGARRHATRATRGSARSLAVGVLLAMRNWKLVARRAGRWPCSRSRSRPASVSDRVQSMFDLERPDQPRPHRDVEDRRAT